MRYTSEIQPIIDEKVTSVRKTRLKAPTRYFKKTNLELHKSNIRERCETKSTHKPRCKRR